MSQSELLSPQEVAQQIDIKTATLAKWRSGQPGRRRRGPAYVRIGGRIRYRATDVLEWLEERTVVPGESKRRRS